uniref:Uncharacterized protein n=1 Tax=Romanomermis culicivorax TaxID=13658 RepID=A0A915IWT1_ROMCU
MAIFLRACHTNVPKVENLDRETPPFVHSCHPILRIGCVVDIRGDSERSVVDFAAYAHFVFLFHIANYNVRRLVRSTDIFNCFTSLFGGPHTAIEEPMFLAPENIKAFIKAHWIRRADENRKHRLRNPATR